MSLPAMSFGDASVERAVHGEVGGAPEGCKQHGCVWAQLKKWLGWHWEGNFCLFWG